MPSPTEHFGWAAFYEDPEPWWADMVRIRQAEADAVLEGQAKAAVREALRILRRRGLLLEDRLSYTRICELEHETEIVSESWVDYLHALHEAELKDRERLKWTTTTTC